MVNNCWNCGGFGHLNYECLLPKNSGSANIKRRLRQQHRFENPQHQQQNLVKHCEKLSRLNEVFRETPVPFTVLKHVVDCTVDKVLELENFLISIKNNVQLCNIHKIVLDVERNHQIAMDLLTSIREINFSQIQYFAIFPNSLSYLDKDIFLGNMETIKTKSKIIGDQITSYLRKLKAMEMNVAYITSGCDELEDFVSTMNESFVPSSKVWASKVSLLDKLFEKLPHLTAVCSDDISKLDKRLMRIRRNSWKVSLELKSQKQEALQEMQKKKFKCYEELRSVLADLQIASQKYSVPEFLSYIKCNHPPKHVQRETVQIAGSRKDVLKALIMYHPDKQPNEDLRWQIMCEEISKYLTVILKSLN